ncbi:MAG TPA: hypothetical protein VGF97_05235 [Rhizomicrobium sp.]
MSEPGHHHTREILNFTGFSNSGYYLLSMNDGYGGFNWNHDVLYMNTSIFAMEPWCDQGYVNVAAATGATALGWIYFEGGAESANLKETFSFKSFLGASAWSSNQEWTISTYTYSAGALHLKGSENIYFGQQAQLVRLGKLGHNISAFSITMDTIGSYGNSCSYGGPTTGYQLAMGNLKFVWNGKIPLRGHRMTTTGMPTHHHATLAAHVAGHATHTNSASHHAADSAHASVPYHSQLLSFGHHSGDLAQQFALPHIDHFSV